MLKSSLYCSHHELVDHYTISSSQVVVIYNNFLSSPTSLLMEQTIRVSLWVSYKKQEQPTLREYLCSLLVGSVLIFLLVFLCWKKKKQLKIIATRRELRCSGKVSSFCSMCSKPGDNHNMIKQKKKLKYNNNLHLTSTTTLDDTLVPTSFVAVQ